MVKAEFKVQLFCRFVSFNIAKDSSVINPVFLHFPKNVPGCFISESVALISFVNKKLAEVVRAIYIRLPEFL